MSTSIPLSDLESSPSAKFENIGDKYVGTIVSMVERQQTDISGKAKFFESGDPMMQWVITLHTTNGDTVALWAKGGNWTAKSGTGDSMLTAIAAAVRNAGATSIDAGGQLAVAHSGLGEAKPGQNAPKLFTAQYQPPAPQAASVDVDDLFS